ncbi:Hypothetical Protein FCC1311_072012 [Hondaea fermentalgiana]|uniref:Uncharacterized protein n=1 Tax=Hondaea fermentalgiana TaxID=2315210 RepID=A0A2R5GJB7_9STRA|nr:Hypothetical Protein FCC1311_072012 [Hondaea fermentalgiana]|eukprot:GBG30980.1 Hypothetical Protein FCC1311_072012 [Hondaea fermentalgiana]
MPPRFDAAQEQLHDQDAERPPVPMNEDNNNSRAPNFYMTLPSQDEEDVDEQEDINEPRKREVFSPKAQAPPFTTTQLQSQAIDFFDDFDDDLEDADEDLNGSENNDVNKGATKEDQGEKESEAQVVVHAGDAHITSILAGTSSRAPGALVRFAATDPAATFVPATQASDLPEDEDHIEQNEVIPATLASSQCLLNADGKLHESEDEDNDEDEDDDDDDEDPSLSRSQTTTQYTTQDKSSPTQSVSANMDLDEMNDTEVGALSHGDDTNEADEDSQCSAKQASAGLSKDERNLDEDTATQEAKDDGAKLTATQWQSQELDLDFDEDFDSDEEEEQVPSTQMQGEPLQTSSASLPAHVNKEEPDSEDATQSSDKPLHMSMASLPAHVEKEEAELADQEEDATQHESDISRAATQQAAVGLSRPTNILRKTEDPSSRMVDDPLASDSEDEEINRLLEVNMNPTPATKEARTTRVLPRVKIEIAEKSPKGKDSNRITQGVRANDAKTVYAKDMLTYGKEKEVENNEDDEDDDEDEDDDDFEDIRKQRRRVRGKRPRVTYLDESTSPSATVDELEMFMVPKKPKCSKRMLQKRAEANKENSVKKLKKKPTRRPLETNETSQESVVLFSSDEDENEDAEKKETRRKRQPGTELLRHRRLARSRSLPRSRTDAVVDSVPRRKRVTPPLRMVEASVAPVAESASLPKVTQRGKRKPKQEDYSSRKITAYFNRQHAKSSFSHERIDE